MGFFDSLKSAASALTGGSAEVSLVAEPLDYLAPFSIRVSATIGEKDLQSKGVYLHVQGTEQIVIPGDKVRRGDQTSNQPVRMQGMTFRIEAPVDNAQILRAGRTYEWTIEVSIPDGAPPIYKGVYAEHSIRALAGIDAFGNDPDSGWKELLPPH